MNPIPFSGNPLDRASDSRTDPGWLAAQHAAGLFLPFWQSHPFVAGGRAVSCPAARNGKIASVSFWDWTGPSRCSR